MTHIVYARDTAREDRQPVLLDAVRTIQLAALVTTRPDGEHKVSHLPLLVNQTPGGPVTLTGHFARANDHWKLIEHGNAISVAIFQGPHTYLSPSNYATKQDTGKVVPTWAYVIVHAHGRAQVRNDPGWLLEHVNALTERNETERDQPWQVSDAPDDYISSMLRGIVGVELEIGRLEGIWKMNQHRSAADQASTIAGLRSSQEPRDWQLAEVMDDTVNGSCRSARP